jgi:hypothetical protein
MPDFVGFVEYDGMMMILILGVSLILPFVVEIKDESPLLWVSSPTSSSAQFRIVSHTN